MTSVCRWRALAWLVVALATAREAPGMRPSWECLPEDTVAMVRLPHAAEFATAVRTSTRFGAVALRPDRLEGLWRLLGEQAAKGGDAAVLGSSAAAWDETLAKYGLATGDLAALFAGDLGLGLVVRPREGLPPLPMVLVWAEPGEEIAGRLLAAVKQRLGEAADAAAGPAPRRIDLELAGHEVVSAVVPVMRPDLGDADLDELAAEGSDDTEGLAGRIERLQERLRDAKRVQAGETHAFHAVMGGRFLYGTTLPASLPGDAAEAGSIEAASGGDEARACFEAFLAAHGGNGEAALARVLREPALASSVPAGVPLVEAVVVPRALVAAAGDAGPEGRRRLAQLGLDDVGGIACWQTFDAGRWRSTFAATLPAPRHGFLAMLDQPCDGCELPAFVTSEVVDFTQISLDLGKAFSGIRESLLADAASDRMANMFDVADVQATTWLGTDVRTFLSGLGSRHWILSFPPRIGAALAEARAAAAAGREGAELPGADSLALVWQPADQEPLVKLLGRLAAVVGGQLEEEQGFRGLRLPGGAAAYVGRGHLVLAVGKGTLEKVLASIRNPPAGEVSWRESDALRRARQLVEMPPARMFAVSDAGRTGGGLGTLRELLANLEPDDVAAGGRELLAAAQKLLPEAAEMEGMFGVGASVLRVTDEGLVLQSAWELPAP